MTILDLTTQKIKIEYRPVSSHTLHENELPIVPLQRESIEICFKYII